MYICIYIYIYGVREKYRYTPINNYDNDINDNTNTNEHHSEHHYVMSITPASG